MLMSGNGERVVFVLDAPGDESLHTGGTIARLLHDGAEVTVLFGSATPNESDASASTAASAAAVAAARTALGETDPTRWRVLAGAPQGVERRAVLVEAFALANATAVVAAVVDPALRQAAVDAAGEQGVPVFLSSRVSAVPGERLAAIDVSDNVDRKLAALAAYPGRWQLDGRVVRLDDGSEVLVTGTESYARGSGPAQPAVLEAPTAGSRLLAALMAAAAGALFGILGTVAHQTTFELGSLTIPLGLTLALLASGTLLLGLRLVVHDRLIVLAAAIGLIATVFLLSLRSTGGSVLVPAGVLGTVWTMAPALFAALVIAWPRIPARRPTA
ncbi:hypothetical protein E3O42_06370 [Cryobacterium adonitolivorans]|uniref:Uncharacterized protein n=1 Tax=Cryobacterium adonitolivorans TaxID=1259189 RepID=A0A4R8WBF4_9MICO|nr:hypothetical protein [Cryobacterium adonitolivorans]TFC03481.1 hypothetical protein E3O42_06370 [Cryobacterium adonitolivorans]